MSECRRSASLLVSGRQFLLVVPDQTEKPEVFRVAQLIADFLDHLRVSVQVMKFPFSEFSVVRHPNFCTEALSCSRTLGCSRHSIISGSVR